MAISPGVVPISEINSSGTLDELTLKVATGELLTLFEERITTMNKVMTRDAKPGAKSYQFPGLGRAAVRRHEAGKNFLEDAAADNNEGTSGGTGTFLSNVNFGEREVFIDDPLKSGVFIDEWEEFKVHYPAREGLLSEIAQALTNTVDEINLQMITKAAFPTTRTGFIDWSGTNLPTEFVESADGTDIETGELDFTDANAATDGSTLLDLIRQVSEYWDNEDVPQMGRFCALPPAQYNLLVQQQDLLNRDFGNTNGVFSDGTVYRAWGIELVKSTHVPTTSKTTSTVGVRNGFTSGYGGDFTATVAALWQKDGVAMVRTGMNMESEYMIQYGGTFLLGKIATGHDVLRPKHCARIGTA